MNRRTRIAVGIVALAALALAVEGARLVRHEGVNARIAAGQPNADDLAHWPQARFAEAAALATRGDWQAALSAWQQAQSRADAAGDGTLAVAARYNSGNLYLREGRRLLEAEGPNPALPLLELAKASYRDVLRRQPGHWDARYNLERALRLAPEERAGEADAGPEPQQSERAVTTMRGFTLGLP